MNDPRIYYLGEEKKIDKKETNSITCYKKKVQSDTSDDIGWCVPVPNLENNMYKINRKLYYNKCYPRLFFSIRAKTYLERMLRIFLFFFFTKIIIM